LIAQVRGPGYRGENRWNWDFRIRHGGARDWQTRDLKFLATAQTLTFFGKRHLDRRANGRDRSEIWKTLSDHLGASITLPPSYAVGTPGHRRRFRKTDRQRRNRLCRPE
jgi:hypothetical protein